MNKIKIIDVSHWEPSVDYAAVAAAGYLGVIAKCTEGNGYLDASYAHHRDAAKAAGLPFGSYHFMRYNAGGVEQAQWYLKNATGTGLFIADVEWADKKVSLGADGEQIVFDFHEEIFRATGKRAWNYTSPGFWVALSNPNNFAQNPLWGAQYGTHLDLPKPWTAATAWQYTGGEANDPNREDVPGAGFIDVSWYYGSAGEFAAACAE